MECVPLVAEPQSGLYTSPVVVLDFQSLYPSIVIAYNICYSTCLGRVPSEPGAFSSPRILGVGHVTLSAARMRTLLRRGDLWVSPNGIAFVRPERRAGVLPRMLSEILGTRVLIKQALKHAKHAARGPDGVDDSQGGSASKSQRNQLFREALCNTLNARQMALKLVANVTYGYTSAGFSGRMPCAEIADAIVETGRRTLEDAIQFVEAHPSWGARVVYGDTDSMFVELKGRTWTEAVKMGAEIAEAAVTRRNPAPVKLKFEKVYHPCFLVSKKRYVGHAYETITQTKPRFDAKGIETVRRDSCPLVAKLLRSSVELMFDTLDASAVRMHVQRAFSRVLTHAAPLTDFIFAKEVNLAGTGDGPCLQRLWWPAARLRETQVACHFTQSASDTLSLRVMQRPDSRIWSLGPRKPFWGHERVLFDPMHTTTSRVRQCRHCCGCSGLQECVLAFGLIL